MSRFKHLCPYLRTQRLMQLLSHCPCDIAPKDPLQGGWRGCATKTENCLGRDKTSAGDVFIAIKIVLITIHWVQLAFDLAYSPFQVTLGRAQQQLEVDAKEALRLAQVASL